MCYAGLARMSSGLSRRSALLALACSTLTTCRGSFGSTRCADWGASRVGEDARGECIDGHVAAHLFRRVFRCAWCGWWHAEPHLRSVRTNRGLCHASQARFPARLLTFIPVRSGRVCAQTHDGAFSDDRSLHQVAEWRFLRVVTSADVFRLLARKDVWWLKTLRCAHVGGAGIANRLLRGQRHLGNRRWDHAMQAVLDEVV